MFWLQENLISMKKTLKKCSTDQRFIRKRNTTYKKGTLISLLPWKNTFNDVWHYISFVEKAVIFGNFLKIPTIVVQPPNMYRACGLYRPQFHPRFSDLQTQANLRVGDLQNQIKIRPRHVITKWHYISVTHIFDLFTCYNIGGTPCTRISDREFWMVIIGVCYWFMINLYYVYWSVTPSLFNPFYWWFI